MRSCLIDDGLDFSGVAVVDVVVLMSSLSEEIFQSTRWLYGVLEAAVAEVSLMNVCFGLIPRLSRCFCEA